MRALVFGFHDFGCLGLECLVRAGFEVAALVTHPDNPREDWFASVSQWARAHDVRTFVPDDVNVPAVHAELSALEPDILFSFYFRKIIRPPLLDLGRHGALNLHGSLLPAYRGRSPVNWVLVNGERETGVTLHYMDEKPDHGDIVAQRRVEILPDDSALTLHRRMLQVAGAMLDEVLPALREGRAHRTCQDHSRSSYFGGRTPEDGRIRWDWSPDRIFNLVRAVTHPFPGAFTHLRGTKLFVWWGRPVAARPTGAPGEITSQGIACTEGAFLPERVQWDGGPEQSWSEFLGSQGIPPGETCECGSNREG